MTTERGFLVATPATRGKSTSPCGHGGGPQYSGKGGGGPPPRSKGRESPTLWQGGGFPTTLCGSPLPYGRGGVFPTLRQGGVSSTRVVRGAVHFLVKGGVPHVVSRGVESLSLWQEGGAPCGKGGSPPACVVRGVGLFLARGGGGVKPCIFSLYL